MTHRPRNRPRTIHIIAGTGLLALIIALPARALVIASGNGLGNSSVENDPAFARAFAHVSFSQMCNATYLGHGVAIGVQHQQPKSVRFDGRWYQLEGAPTYQIPDADLVLKRIVGQPLPELPTLATISKSPAAGTPVRMVAGGYHRAAQPTRWGVKIEDAKTWTWTESGNGPNATLVGYKNIEPREQVLRWGTNVVQETNVAGGRMFVTRFDPPGQGGTEHEAQGTGWDSGGAVFTFNRVTGAWELAGVMTSVAACFPNTPDPRRNSVFLANATVIADLSLYRRHIVWFMVTPRSQSNDAAPLQGDGASVQLLGGPAQAGGMSLVFTSANALVVTAEYQTVFPDMTAAYFDTQEPGFKSFDFPHAGGTPQLWKLNKSAGSMTGPLTVTVHYDRALLPPAIGADRLAIYRLQDGNWHVVPTRREAGVDTLTFTTQELGVFALGLTW